MFIFAILHLFFCHRSTRLPLEEVAAMCFLKLKEIPSDFERTNPLVSDSITG